jgi:hypothetical protein
MYRTKHHISLSSENDVIPLQRCARINSSCIPFCFYYLDLFPLSYFYPSNHSCRYSAEILRRGGGTIFPDIHPGPGREEMFRLVANAMVMPGMTR